MTMAALLRIRTICFEPAAIHENIQETTALTNDNKQHEPACSIFSNHRLIFLKIIAEKQVVLLPTYCYLYKHVKLILKQRESAQGHRLNI